MIRLLIADSHAYYRTELRKTCEMESDLRVVGETDNGRQAVDLSLALRPDVALLGLRLSNLDGIQATRMIQRTAPDTQIIILTMYPDREQAFNAFQAGAHAFITKDMPNEHILQTIRAVGRGETLLDPHVTARLLKELRQARQTPIQ